MRPEQHNILKNIAQYFHPIFSIGALWDKGERVKFGVKRSQNDKGPSGRSRVFSMIS